MSSRRIFWPATEPQKVSDFESSISESDCESLIASPSHDSKIVKLKHLNRIWIRLVHRVIISLNMILMLRH